MALAQVHSIAAGEEGAVSQAMDRQTQVRDTVHEPRPRSRPSAQAAGYEALAAAPDLPGGKETAQTFAELTVALASSVAGLAASQAEMVTRLGRMVEYRDDDTGAHVRRVSRFSARLASLAGLDPAYCELIGYASALHDVGKVAIPDAVLRRGASPPTSVR